jgi:hypothetical protein
MENRPASRRDEPATAQAIASARRLGDRERRAYAGWVTSLIHNGRRRAASQAETPAEPSDC